MLRVRRVKDARERGETEKLGVPNGEGSARLPEAQPNFRVVVISCKGPYQVKAKKIHPPGRPSLDSTGMYICANKGLQGTYTYFRARTYSLYVYVHQLVRTLLLFL